MPDNPFVGMLFLGGFNFAPVDYAVCNGQLLSISENSTLFNLIGTTYGGDGQTTFALPDLQGRAPVGMGQGSGLSNYVIGQLGGVEQVTLTSQQMPAHTHAVNTQSAGASVQSPGGALLATPRDPAYTTSTPSSVQMAAGAISSTVGNQPHANVPPYLAIGYYISLYGIYPSQ